MKREKLVRDRIPEIIRSRGGNPVVRVARDDEEYVLMLMNKLDEEVGEYLMDGDPGELADILEVIYALCDAKRITREELELLRKNKAEERGGFKKRIFLEES